MFRLSSLSRIRWISRDLLSSPPNPSFSRSISSSPWLTLPPTIEGDDRIYNFYSLADDKVVSFNKGYIAKGPERFYRRGSPDDSVIVGSSHGYLALLDHRRGGVFLYNPISGWLRELPPVANLLDPYDLTLLTICKFTLSCSPDLVSDTENRAKTPEQVSSDCRAMISFGRGGRLAFCLPHISFEWTPISTPDHVHRARRFQDFVYSPTDKLFNCITKASLHVWDLREQQAPRVETIRWLPGWYPSTILDPNPQIGINKEDTYPWPDISEEDNKLKMLCRHLKYLISLSDGRLFLVIRHVVEQMAPDGSPYVEPDQEYPILDEQEYYEEAETVEVDYPYKTIGFAVHQIVRDEPKWWLSYMEDCLDGLAMFVGNNQSFALSAAEFPELKPNAIYFADDKDLSLFMGWPKRSSYGGHDVGIFDYENKTISPCYYPCDYHSLKRIDPAPMWFTPTSYN